MRIRAGAGRGNSDSAEKNEISPSHFLCRVLTLSRQVSLSRQLAILALVLSFTVKAATQKVESIPIPGAKAFPESITSSSDGALFVGRIGDGGVVRVNPRTAESTVFVQLGAAGSRSIL